MIHVTDRHSEKEKNWMEVCKIYLQNSTSCDRRAKVLSQMFDYIQTGKLPFNNHED